MNNFFLKQGALPPALLGGALFQGENRVERYSLLEKKNICENGAFVGFAALKKIFFGIPLLKREWGRVCVRKIVCL